MSSRWAGPKTRMPCPMTLGQEFGAYAVMIGSAMAATSSARREELHGHQHGSDRHRHGHQQPAGLCRIWSPQKLAEVSGLPVCKAAATWWRRRRTPARSRRCRRR